MYTFEMNIQESQEIVWIFHLEYKEQLIINSKYMVIHRFETEFRSEKMLSNPILHKMLVKKSFPSERQ